MKTLTEINEERQFNKELMGLLDVMKGISIFRFRALQRRKRSFPRFVEELNGFFDMIDFKNVKHPFVSPRTETSAVVVITSDQGFMGGLNLQVIEAAIGAREAYRAELIVVGERGARHMSDIGRKNFISFKNVTTFEERYRLAIELKDHILNGAKEGRFGKAFIFYPRPVTFIFQKVEGMQLLPLSSPGQRQFSAGDIIIESPLGGIIEFLAEEDVVYKLVDALEDSKLSEFAARSLHLEGSTRQLKEKEKGLRFQYFRAYHELIDKNIRDLFSAQVIGRRKK